MKIVLFFVLLMTLQLGFGQDQELLKLKAAELIQLCKVDDVYKDMIESFESDGEDAGNEFNQMYLTELKNRRTEYQNMLIDLYTELYTLEEINKCIEFYSTEIGRQLIMKDKIVKRQMLELTAMWVENISVNVSSRLDSLNNILLNSENTNCQSFHTGDYAINSGYGVEFKLHRESYYQNNIYDYEGEMTTDEYTIDWVSDCSYKIISKNDPNDSYIGTIYSKEGDVYKFIEKNIVYEYFIKGVATRLK